MIRIQQTGASRFTRINGLRFLCLFLFVLLFSFSGYSQHYFAYIQKADSCYEAKSFLTSAQFYQKAVGSINENYVNPNVYCSCSSSFLKANKKDDAVRYLKKCIQRAGISAPELEASEDWIDMKKSKDWKTVMHLANNQEKKRDTTLIKKLKDIGKKDQFYRSKIDSISRNKVGDAALRKSYFRQQAALDSVNLLSVAEILQTQGYPDRAKAFKYAINLFFVVQHSDISTMEKYYPLFEKAAESGDLDWKALVLMTDRIRKKKGLKQVYGTQTVKGSDGKWVLYDVENIEGLNERRLKIGLEPIDEYLKLINL